ncbi:methylmalonic aciduria type A homolog [Striga asiatica]|uniref:Methylmalonic aciduria type A homolog n=1 Tax=Striga asiatica TaxID=4170 RepID=A0A5A7QDK7_STRAF|nr:methylmalonic aciduria type A homolog [Striga asiatica]
MLQAYPNTREKFLRQASEDDGATKNSGAAVDFPAESFWLSKDAEHDWVDRNAVYQRKESTRGNSNLNGSSSQRSSAKSKASVIGLPRAQRTAFTDSNRRACKAAKARLFPTKGKKSAVPEAEPASPKVSCMGRVRSKRGRLRDLSDSPRAEGKQAEKSGTGGGEERRSGFCAKVMSFFRFKKGRGEPYRSGSGKVAEGPEEPAAEPPRRSVVLRAGGEPPALGGMVRFSSGRRSGTWAAEEIIQAM